MSENRPLTVFRRRLWHEPSILVVTGHAGPLWAGRRRYEERHGITGGDGQAAALDRLLAACALAAVILPVRESWGWNVTLPGEEHGYFVASEPEGFLSARVLPARRDVAAAVVQRQRPGEPRTDSHFDPDPTDVAGAVQRYFEDAAQIATRVAVDPDGRAALAQVLPGGRLDDLYTLDDRAFLDRIGGLADDDTRSRAVEEVVLFYECRCSEETVRRLVDTLASERRLELWGQTDHLEIECPRCGRQFRLDRPGA